MQESELRLLKLNQFNSLRMTAFPNAYFEKDNDARTGSKRWMRRPSTRSIRPLRICRRPKNAPSVKAMFDELQKD